MKKLFLLLFFCVALSAQGPINVTTFPSVATMRTVPVASAAFYKDVQVTSYYGTPNNCPIYYHWNASDSTADNGGTVINPTGNSGNGRWNANMPKGPVHTCWFGVKPDGTTNNATQLQATLNAAHTTTNWVHIDGIAGSGSGDCTNRINFGTTLSVPEGEIVEGDGQGTAGSGIWGNTCLNFTNTAGWALETLSVQSGIGTTPFESPKFRDFALYTTSSTSAGGCIRINTIAGGFTDDASSQQYVVHPEVRNVLCYMGFITNNGQIGFQCSKCFEGTLFHSDFYNGLTGIDLEGSDNMSVDGGFRVTNTYGPLIKLQSHNTFGNNDTIQNGQLLLIADTGAGQTVDSMLLDTARSSTISNLFFEAAAPAGGAITSVIHLNGGFSAGIHDNNIGTTSPPRWLTVDGIYTNITAINNGSSGGIISRAVFNNGNYFFNGSGLQQNIVHFGNTLNADFGWPFNSKAVEDIPYTSNVVNIFTPSYQGLSYLAQGTTEIPADNKWQFPLTGSLQYLDWRGSVQGAARTGTFDTQIFAYQPGGGTAACTITDGGTPVAGGYTTQVVTASPAWYTIANAQTASSDAGVRCYNAGGAGLVMAQVNIVKH